MRGSIIVETAGITTSIAKATTSYPHGLTRRNSVTIRGSSDAAYNGTHQVRASDDFTFEYYVDGENDSVPNGVLEYNFIGVKWIVEITYNAVLLVSCCACIS